MSAGAAADALRPIASGPGGLRRRDAALLAAVLALWTLCFVLHTAQLARGRLAWVPLYVEADPGATEPPRVQALWPEAPPTTSPLVAGDRLLRAGETPLQGAGRFALLARLFAAADAEGRVSLRVERAGAQHDATLALLPIAYPWRNVALSLIYAAVGGLAYWRARGSPAVRAAFLSTVFYAMHWTTVQGPSLWEMRFAFAMLLLAPAVTSVQLIRVLLRFPEETARHDLASRLWPWLFVLNGLAVAGWAFGTPLPHPLGRPLAPLGMLALAGTAMALIAHSYLRAGAAGRRQLRWALLGIYLGLVGPLVGAAALLLDPKLYAVHQLALCTVVALPICLFIGLDRDHLLDVDRLISATTSFTLLGALLMVGLLTLVPSAASALSSYARLDADVSRVALSLLVTALVLPAQRLLRPGVERVLFRERHALEAGARRLREDLGRCEKPEELLTLLGERLDAMLQPGCVAIYGDAGDAFAPIFARGPAIAPAFDARGPLLALLEQTGTPLPLARPRGRSRRAAQAERAALDAMGVQVLVPLVLEGELAAFVGLGEKGSGDIYTATDLALLQGLSERASGLLLRFGQAETQRQERAMMERLRRYVPGSIAEELASGHELEAGEREVSVLFVDVRGYSTISAGMRPEEIFSTVNHYTEAVSSVVRRHGGTVVEFNGDGMMAVFGAPRELEGKEAAALRAAREIVEAVGAIALGGARLSVGVGVATGDAFVGSIRAVDRMIWSAIGNTTNLAARLQSLTRDLDVAIAIDSPSFAAAGAAAQGFELRAEQRIRGRSELFDIYTLPLPAAPSQGAPAAGRA